MRLGYLSLTNYCPNKCIACPCIHRKSDMRDLTLHQVQESVACAECEGKLDRIILSGGEPTFNVNFLDIMHYLASKDFPVSLTTTSQRFSDKVFLWDLLSVFPKERLSITSTLHSFTPDIHDKLTGVTGSFNDWFRGMKNVEDAGVKFTLKNLITSFTYKDLQTFVTHYYSDFGDQTNLYICGLDFSGMAKSHSKLLRVRFSDLRPYLQSALEYSDNVNRHRDTQRSVSVLDIPYCALDERFRCHIPMKRDEDQKLALYNAPDSPSPRPRTALNKKKGVPGECCSMCRDRNHCPGIWNSAMNVYCEDEFRPIR